MNKLLKHLLGFILTESHAPSFSYCNSPFLMTLLTTPLITGLVCLFTASSVFGHQMHCLCICYISIRMQLSPNTLCRAFSLSTDMCTQQLASFLNSWICVKADVWNGELLAGAQPFSLALNRHGTIRATKWGRVSSLFFNSPTLQNSVF